MGDGSTLSVRRLAESSVVTIAVASKPLLPVRGHHDT